MEQLQSYTNKLRKTYRQSLDVILPFTSHETVVYCNDGEFESYLEDQKSAKDLQVCIYLLERHIDLQQEIIRELIHLQDMHKNDRNPSDYNETVEKLITAQSKLAILRSRTVRCLTRQIQLRVGDSNIHLPAWSSKESKKRSSTEVDVSPLANGDYANGGYLKSEIDLPVVSNAATSKSSCSGKAEPLSVLCDDRVNGVGHLRNANSDKPLSEKMSETMVTHNSVITQNKDNTLTEICSVTTKSAANVNGDSTRQENMISGEPCTSPPRGILSDNMLSNLGTSEDSSTVVSDDQSGSCAEVKVNHDMEIFAGVSSDMPGRTEEAQQGSTRHVVEPVEETVTVELLKPTSRDDERPSTLESANGGNTAPETSTESETANLCKSTCDDAPDEVVSDSTVKTLNWDPRMLIGEILGQVKPIKCRQTDHSADADEVQMAGYLEKLPVNKKKASFIKSWRKRYFKILNGKLFYFEDHRAKTPISFIKLAGCQVTDTGNKCLEVTEREDLGSKRLIIRCATWPEVQDWRKALESQEKERTQRQHFELVPEKTSVIIIDFGSSSIKAGFLENDAWPQVLIPAVYAVHKEDSNSTCYGYDALKPSVRDVSKLVFPLRPPVTVGKYLLDPNELIGFLEIIFRELQVDPSHYKVVMTTPVNLRDRDQERLVEIMFDYFQVAAVHVKSQAILSMYSYSATSGILVNVGDNIDVVPIEDGYIVESGVNSLPYGGRQVTDHFIRLLSSSGYRYFSEVENYIGEYLKIRTCCVSQDLAEEMTDEASDDPLAVDMSKFDLPSGDKTVMVGRERLRAYEGLFRPELWGKDTPGLTDMVHQAVMACSIDNRKDMCRNIFLSGATTKAPGFPERLQNELSRKFPSSLGIQVHAACDRQFAAFIGAAVLASLDTFDDLCISSEEWEERGPSALQKWDSV